MPFFLGLIALLLVVEYFWWIVVAASVVICFLCVRALVRQHRVELARRRDRLAATASRADQQQRWHLAGDPRGLHGIYPPAT